MSEEAYVSFADNIKDVLSSHRLERKSATEHAGVCSCGVPDYRGYTVNTDYCQSLHREHLTQEIISRLT